MPAAKKLLIIDDNPDGRVLLVRTLRRKFPNADLLEVADAGTALSVLGGVKFDAVISHRAGEFKGEQLVRLLRTANANVPIVMISGIERTEAARAAGANRFLNYDQWLLLGGIIEEMIAEALPKIESPQGEARTDM